MHTIAMAVLGLVLTHALTPIVVDLVYGTVTGAWWPLDATAAPEAEPILTAQRDLQEMETFAAHQ